MRKLIIGTAAAAVLATGAFATGTDKAETLDIGVSVALEAGKINGISDSAVTLSANHVASGILIGDTFNVNTTVSKEGQFKGEIEYNVRLDSLMYVGGSVGYERFSTNAEATIDPDTKLPVGDVDSFDTQAFASLKLGVAAEGINFYSELEAGTKKNEVSFNVSTPLTNEFDLTAKASRTFYSDSDSKDTNGFQIGIKYSF